LNIDVYILYNTHKHNTSGRFIIIIIIIYSSKTRVMALARNTTEIIIVRRQMFEYQGHKSSNVFSSFKTAITNRYLWVLYLPTTERCFKDFLYVVAYYLIPSYQLYHRILRNIIYIYLFRAGIWYRDFGI